MLVQLRRLEYHVKKCLAINHIKSDLLYEEIEYINIQNFKRLAKSPFMIYGDSECVLIPLTDNIEFFPNAKKYQDHIVCSYSHKIICFEKKIPRPYCLQL